VFYHTPEQQKIAMDMKNKLNLITKEKFQREIVTEIKPEGEFYEAESYHQQYFGKKGIIY
jgi:peptide-methionine (S)-S-oxide reductase